MSSTIFFFLFIPLLTFILLAINLIFAPHNPYMEKNSAFECGFSSFLGQNRIQFSISFFIFALLFLLFDLEILLVYPYLVSAYTNGIYGLVVLLIFLLALTLGFAFELGKKALSIDSRQNKKTPPTLIMKQDAYYKAQLPKVTHLSTLTDFWQHAYNKIRSLSWYVHKHVFEGDYDNLQLRYTKKFYMPGHKAINSLYLIKRFEKSSLVPHQNYQVEFAVLKQKLFRPKGIILLSSCTFVNDAAGVIYLTERFSLFMRKFPNVNPNKVNIVIQTWPIPPFEKDFIRPIYVARRPVRPIVHVEYRHINTNHRFKFKFKSWRSCLLYWRRKIGL